MFNFSLYAFHDKFTGQTDFGLVQPNNTVPSFIYWVNTSFRSVQSFQLCWEIKIHFTWNSMFKKEILVKYSLQSTITLAYAISFCMHPDDFLLSSMHNLLINLLSFDVVRLFFPLRKWFFSDIVSIIRLQYYINTRFSYIYNNFPFNFFITVALFVE